MPTPPMLYFRFDYMFCRYFTRQYADYAAMAYAAAFTDLL